MGDECNGHAMVLIQVVKEVHDHATGGGVERTGGLVGKHEIGRVAERPGNGYPLFLAAGQFGGQVVGALLHAHHF